MKSLLVVVGTIGVLTAPAVAGNTKKKPAKPVVLAAAAKPDAAAPAVVKPDAAPPAPADTAATPSEQIDIPVLPADTSSPLQAFPDLELRPVTTTKPVKPAKPSKEKAPVMKMGGDYVLGKRGAPKQVRDVEKAAPKSLSHAQVATVVQSHMDDIRNCWDLVPKAQRADTCTANLELSISEAGAVTDIEIGGDVPADAQTCMTGAIARWAFPVAETHTEIEYGVSLRSL